MSTAELKSSLHRLIDGMEDSKLLESLHDFLSERKNAESGAIWNSLTTEQKQEVMDAFEESEDVENLTLHSEFLRKFE